MIIVFGAAGFIGTYLVDQLIREGFKCTASDIDEFGKEFYEKQDIPFVRLDITDKQHFGVLPTRDIDVVVHLACVQPANLSESEYDPTAYIRVNVIGTLNILEYCRTCNVPKIIYVSSHRNTQGLWKRGRPVREEEGRAIKYSGEYALFSISETAAQDCVAHYTDQYGLQGIVLRLPPVYGYGPHTEIFKDGKPMKTGFQIFIESALEERPLEVWGDCTQGRDIVYVKDVVDALVKVVQSKTAIGLYNIASGNPLTLKEEVEEIARAFWPRRSAPKIVYRPEKPNSTEPFLYDISKAKKELGWIPKYDFRKMLVDYKTEMEKGRFDHLLEKRRRILAGK